ncbi:sensor histidine kinase [Brevibacillus migulae]|uniref:sensor histidine kinase n=1 Tax=Brevibacillus migulae TaxID=1644114 RepID=UPI00106E8AFB|nr:ATP-binding protein [Brevibacillus migulae]
MENKQEILQKLTGIHSSRKSYYTELNTLVEEMKKKNKQLEVINELTKIQVNATWPEVSHSIASSLSQLFCFQRFALTLVKGPTFSSYVSACREGKWHCQTLTQQLLPGSPPQVGDVEERLRDSFPGFRFLSVALRSHLNQTFGFLTLLLDAGQPGNPEERILFSQIAEHVGVSVENIMLYQDVSEKVKIEAQLIQSAKMAAVGEMAAGIAHELNSPLTAILGNSQLLLREFQSGPLHPLLKDIHQCGVRCKKIIQNLLTFSRQEEYQFECLSINELIHDVLSLIGYQITVSGITITKELTASPLFFRGSRHQIEQILINLLLNARDALVGTPAPAIVLKTFSAEQEGIAYAAFSITDNGQGIPPDHLSQIFQPFFTTKTSTKGTGLGLSVSLGIAQAHGGQLLARSQVGHFSTFTLLLPLVIPEEIADANQACIDRR